MSKPHFGKLGPGDHLYYQYHLVKTTPTINIIPISAYDYTEHSVSCTEQNKPKTLNGRFFFLWIAFNAAYATDIVEQQRLSEGETFKAFLEKPCSLVATITSRLRLVGVSRQHSRTTGQPVHPAQPSSFMVEQPGMAE